MLMEILRKFKVKFETFGYTIEFVTKIAQQNETMLTGCRSRQLIGKALTLEVKVPQFDSRSWHLSHIVVKKGIST